MHWHQSVNQICAVFLLIACSVFAVDLKISFQIIISKFWQILNAKISNFRSVHFVFIGMGNQSLIYFVLYFLFLIDVLKMRKRASDHSRVVVSDNAKLKADLEAKRKELDTLVSENKKRTSSNSHDLEVNDFFSLNSEIYVF